MRCIGEKKRKCAVGTRLAQCLQTVERDFFRAGKDAKPGATTVRLKSRRHVLYSDASRRFGRGADPRMPRIARDLLVGRLQAWAGATVESLWTVGAEPDSKAAIRLPEALLNRIAGLPLPLAEAARGLRALGCDVEEEPSGLSVIAPSWRHDLAIPEDLAEEVLRLRGYEHLGSSLPPLDADPQPMDPQVLRAQSLARRMAHVGFHQTVTYGFVSPEADAEFATTPQEGRLLGNPLGQEYSVLRGSLLPSLRAAALHNLRQGEKEVRLFEIAPIYLASPEGPQARPTLGVVWGGSLEDRAPLGLDQAQPRPVHAADLVGLARSVGAPGTVVRDLGEGLLGLELGLDELPVPEERIIPEFGKAMRAFSRIPSAERDLSLLVDLGQDYAGLREAMVRAVPGALGGVLQSLRVVEIFRHKSLPPGKQAWLFRLSFRHPERTLTREEVDGWMAGVLEAAQALGAELRG